MNPLDEPMHHMDTISVSPWSTILKYGLIGGAGIIILSIFNFLFGHETNSFVGASIISLAMSVLIVIIYASVMVLSIKEYRDKLSDGYITLGKGMIVSYGAAMFMGVLSLLFTLLYLLVIDPNYMNRLFEKSYEDLGLTDSMPASNLYTPQLIIGSQIGSFIFGAIVGLVLSLIISAIMKRDRPRYAPTS